MVWAVALYLRGHPLIAGVVLGIGTACKELAPYALLVVVVFELMRALSAPPVATGVGGDRRAAGRVRGGHDRRVRRACSR